MIGLALRIFARPLSEELGDWITGAILLCLFACVYQLIRARQGR